MTEVRGSWRRLLHVFGPIESESSLDSTSRASGRAFTMVRQAKVRGRQPGALTRQRVPCSYLIVVADDDSRNLSALRGFPERIPVFTFQHDGISLRGGLQAFEFVRADDRKRLTRVRENPGVG